MSSCLGLSCQFGLAIRNSRGEKGHRRRTRSCFDPLARSQTAGRNQILPLISFLSEFYQQRRTRGHSKRDLWLGVQVSSPALESSRPSCKGMGTLRNSSSSMQSCWRLQHAQQLRLSWNNLPECSESQKHFTVL